MLKKILSYFLSLCFAVILIGGCITPAYYSHQQDINIHIPEGATAELDGKPLTEKGNHVHTTVNRSWIDKEIIVKKEGYKDEKIKLKSVPTEDKWAGNFFQEGNGSWGWLFLPVHTLVSSGATAVGTTATGVGLVTLDPELMTEGVAISGMGLLTLPFSAAIDLLNIFVGAPTTAIVNPWNEYEYTPTIEKMQPLDAAETDIKK